MAIGTLRKHGYALLGIGPSKCITKTLTASVPMNRFAPKSYLKAMLRSHAKTAEFLNIQTCEFYILLWTPVLPSVIG